MLENKFRIAKNRNEYRITMTQVKNIVKAYQRVKNN